MLRKLYRIKRLQPNIKRGYVEQIKYEPKELEEQIKKNEIHLRQKQIEKYEKYYFAYCLVNSR